MKTTVLVCGSTGFIGRNIAEKLASREDMEVYGSHFSRDAPPIPGLKAVHLDLTNAQAVEAAVEGMDVIIQAAAVTSGSKDVVNRPHIHVTDNAIMNSLIFRAVHEHKVAHAVFFSCSIMYASSDRPLKESDFDASVEFYPSYFGAGWTKLYMEKMAEFYARLGRTKYTVIRHSNIYGPHDKFDLERSHVFGATMTKVLTCRDGKVVVWGPGTEKRDLLYVADLVDFVEKALQRQDSKYELVNVGKGQAVTVKDLVRKIIKISGRTGIVIEHDLSKPNISTSVTLDISRAREVFGWHPSTELEEGIRKTLASYPAFLRS